jgi:predicted ATPase
LSLLPSARIKSRIVGTQQAALYPKVQVLPSAVIFGPNNAGKSNLLRALTALQWLVRHSGSFNSDQKLGANEFFAFDRQTRDKPTTFEIDFIAPNQKWYSYAVTFSATAVLHESLHGYNVTESGKTTQTTLYIRENQAIKFVALKGVRKEIRFEPNQLFLSRGDIEGNEELKGVYAFFSQKLSVFQLAETEYTNYLTNKYKSWIASEEEAWLKPLVEKVLRESDTAILGIRTDAVDANRIVFPDSTPQELKDKIFDQIKYEIRTVHRLFDGEAEVGVETISLDDESIGTRKLLGITPSVLLALRDGTTLLIDEMNTSMHTAISFFLISLFNNPVTNPNSAQLIITSHDISLINEELYSRDQMVGVEKTSMGATELYAFADITGLRKEARLDDYYATGRLGGTPRIASAYLQEIIAQSLTHGKAES